MKKSAKKLLLMLATLCLVAGLALAVPTVSVHAQGTANSGPKPPPPPPPPATTVQMDPTVLLWIIAAVF